MKFLKLQLLILSLLIFTGTVYTQNNDEPDNVEKKQKNKKPARDPFASAILLDQQTYITNKKKTFEFVMQHRFGTINTSIEKKEFDLLGIFGGTNVRLGFNYSILDILQIGIGSSKQNLSQDLNWKVAALRQTRTNRIPISITYYGMAVVEARNKDLYKKAAHRFNYFQQVIIGRKFHKAFSMQIYFNYAHFNVVDSSTFIPEDATTPAKHDRKHDNFAVGLLARIKVSPQTSIVLEYTQPLTLPEVDKPEPNLALGVEIATSSHAFQVFLSTYNFILPQHNMVFNTNRFWKGEILIGFNITRLWNF